MKKQGKRLLSKDVRRKYVDILFRQGKDEGKYVYAYVRQNRKYEYQGDTKRTDEEHEI